MPLLLTPGEPAGIGPDICLQTLASCIQQPTSQPFQSSDIIVIANTKLLAQRAKQLGLSVDFNSNPCFDALTTKLSNQHINVLNIALANDATAGILNKHNSRYVLDCLDIAEQLCRTNEADALVTAPVHKGIINDAGFSFTGHTEYLAAPTNSTPVMMLATEAMRVVLATTHLRLRDIADAITQQGLIQTITILNTFLQTRYRIAHPHIYVCGLNPHAGEDGHLGNEEIETITPALNALRNQGMNITGPLPADTLFNDRNLSHADAVLAMYHDQGLPVLKYSGFGKAVNITMGLPFIRTSVDHGTALELAGTGKANNHSLIAAINMAQQLSS